GRFGAIRRQEFVVWYLGPHGLHSSCSCWRRRERTSMGPQRSQWVRVNSAREMARDRVSRFSGPSSRSRSWMVTVREFGLANASRYSPTAWARSSTVVGVLVMDWVLFEGGEGAVGDPVALKSRRPALPFA